MSDYEFNYKVWLIVSQVLTFLGVVFFVAMTISRFSFKVSELIAAYFQAHCAYLTAGRAARKAKLDEVLPKKRNTASALPEDEEELAMARAAQRQSDVEYYLSHPPKGFSISK